jgi:hypothetical protein
MIPMLEKLLEKLVSPHPSIPEPDPDVITSTIKPEPGAILGNGWKIRR